VAITAKATRTRVRPRSRWPQEAQPGPLARRPHHVTQHAPSPSCRHKLSDFGKVYRSCPTLPPPTAPAPARGFLLSASARRRYLATRPLLAILNSMVQYQLELDRTFSALSDPTRRAILERLGRGPATIGELAEPFGMSLTGLKKHVRVLEEADLVVTQKIGRARRCRLGPGRLEDATRWIEEHRSRWERRLDRLEGYIEERREGGDG